MPSAPVAEPASALGSLGRLSDWFRPDRAWRFVGRVCGCAGSRWRPGRAHGRGRVTETAISERGDQEQITPSQRLNDPSAARPEPAAGLTAPGVPAGLGVWQTDNTLFLVLESMARLRPQF